MFKKFRTVTWKTNFGLLLLFALVMPKSVFACSTGGPPVIVYGCRASYWNIIGHCHATPLNEVLIGGFTTAGTTTAGSCSAGLSPELNGIIQSVNAVDIYHAGTRERVNGFSRFEPVSGPGPLERFKKGGDNWFEFTAKVTEAMTPDMPVDIVFSITLEDDFEEDVTQKDMRAALRKTLVGVTKVNEDGDLEHPTVSQPGAIVLLAPEPLPRFEYATTVICGKQDKPNDIRLARGFYATTINIHNPTEQEVGFLENLALTQPSQEPFGDILRLDVEMLRPGEALAINCGDVQKVLSSGGISSPYIQGVIVVQSEESLDVSAVYTTSALNKSGYITAHSSIQVQRVHERIK